MTHLPPIAAHRLLFGLAMGQRRLRRQDRDRAMQARAAAAARVQQMGESPGGVEDEARIAGGRRRAVGQLHLVPAPPRRLGVIERRAPGAAGGMCAEAERLAEGHQRLRHAAGTQQRHDAIGHVALGDAVQRKRHAAPGEDHAVGGAAAHGPAISLIRLRCALSQLPPVPETLPPSNRGGS